MKFLGKYWKVLLALLLVAAAAWMYFQVYETELASYESQSKQLKSMITTLEKRIQENMKYADVQDKLEPATEQVEASRAELYAKFPVDMKQEDQILYALYLETVFGTEINLDKVSHIHGGYNGLNFVFGTPQPVQTLSDGAILKVLPLTVNYETTYKGFQDMLKYLSTDSRITSIQVADITYDAKNDKALGTMSLLLYLLESEGREYIPPEVFQPETGKENLFD